MKKIVLMLSILILSCDNSIESSDVETSQYILKEEINSYEISDGKLVAKVQVSLYNPGNDTLLGYRAQINYNNETYIDTLKYTLKSGDTVYGELIFSQLPFHKDLEKSLQSEMVAY